MPKSVRPTLFRTSVDARPEPGIWFCGVQLTDRISVGEPIY
jgi:hypothetical protein